MRKGLSLLVTILSHDVLFIGILEKSNECLLRCMHVCIKYNNDWLFLKHCIFCIVLILKHF